MSRSHSRNPSEETTSSYNMILEHVLQYPGSYEIPLRTMYTLNCAPRAQPLPKDASRAPTPTGQSPVSGQYAWSDAETATMNFTSQLMSHMVSLPSQPSSLPPTFIVSFVSRCFSPSIDLVDFPQALTALDYLRDLETRRCKEVTAAFERLGIRVDSFGADVDAVSERYPGIALWAKNIEGKNKKAEAYYSQLYIGLRRWIMINELTLTPFNKLNCMGMLNTLFPPQAPGAVARNPAPLLTPQMLKQEREAFFEYIRLVQQKGSGVLKNMMQMHKTPEDATGWDPVQRSVDKYLRVAKNMIDDCLATTGTDDFTSIEEARKGKKTDSGVSFGSEKRPSTGSSIHEKPLPTSPIDPMPAVPPVKGLSKLERLTREFKRMRVRTRPEVEEIVKVDKQSAASFLPAPNGNKGPKSLKKARSFANIASNLRSANASTTSLTGSRKGSDAVPFDAEQMKRHRMLYEASSKLSKISA
ncbi:hypothetical protein BDV96DRAFT_599787 [Lophiotrema nucula]|uniref:HAUS augmin-like complex subunit 6 N-terminus-domain-containing protein n=1 Tax=Lophiotrema nucula TaxID=690887 RepID=A0A6A5Z7R5_9PLEO|nr:hypothetical protein BDV96DRAFT_599787 [Lophiotrema nucula]